MASETIPFVDRALAVAARQGIARTRDFTEAGIASPYIKQLVEDGRLIRLGRGLYQLPETAGTDANHDLAEAAKLVPSGVICLLSALRFHGLTTQLPDAVWVLIPHKARSPRDRRPRLEIVRASAPRALTEGVTKARIEAVDVPITSPARTIADCFKYRRRVGVDVAIEALQDALKQRICSTDELMRFAHFDRVSSVMRPYLEALSA